MRVTTLNQDKIILSVTNDIDKISKDVHEQILYTNVFKAKSILDYVNDIKRLKTKVNNLYTNYLFDELSYEKINLDIFQPLENGSRLEITYINNYLAILRKRINKLKSKEGKTKGIIKNLEHPVLWEQITLIFNGDSVKIKQNETNLGDYSLKVIGIPKPKSSSTGSVYKMFIALFQNDMRDLSSILESTNNANQKNKSNLSRILKNAFDTNKDPIRKDTKTKLYRPIFQANTGGDLRINNYRSGGELFDDTLEIEV